MPHTFIAFHGSEPLLSTISACPYETLARAIREMDGTETPTLADLGRHRRREPPLRVLRCEATTATARTVTLAIGSEVEI